MNDHALKLRADRHKFILRVQGFIPNCSYFELVIQDSCDSIYFEFKIFKWFL